MKLCTLIGVCDKHTVSIMMFLINFVFMWISKNNNLPEAILYDRETSVATWRRLTMQVYMHISPTNAKHYKFVNNKQPQATNCVCAYNFNILHPKNTKRDTLPPPIDQVVKQQQTSSSCNLTISFSSEVFVDTTSSTVPQVEHMEKYFGPCAKKACSHIKYSTIYELKERTWVRI